ncbi:hypothetical protein AZI86_11390 [Bdellovibrio bacteriovorus]|uniref:DUF4423 domain-containing protein n=1 Tax=Bdellovibrio bacteriovorus TaxID=959 RepID=A0A150WLB5_BDEBC|nr:TIGR02147 family protein [Bdellovibrio bacteriovorus]KYG64801.1 hypothetical protein AZI86_11390 [Bdellovibrio bacteriovorus]
MKESTLKVPVVFDYLDVLAYLKAYYSFRKKNQKQFSYQTWSTELNFKSRSFLRMIVTGKKKVTPKLAESIAQNNFQTKAEKDYFHYLVKHSQSASARERDLYAQKMIELIRKQTRSEVIKDSDDFISHPILPRMLSLFSYKDFEPTATNFARVLNINIADTLVALELLQRMGLAKNEGDRWLSHVVTFKVPDNFGSFNLTKFHEKSLAEAMKAFELPTEVRRYKSLLLPMDTEGLKKYFELLDNFSAEQMSRFNSATCQGKRVFQANFNIYPVTETL